MSNSSVGSDNNVFLRAKEFLAQEEKEANRVPLKVFMPLIENASLEEDDQLQDRWAALLANAATGDGVLASYVETLKQLTKYEVDLLRDAFYQFYPLALRYGLPKESLRGVIHKWGDKLEIELGESLAEPRPFRIYHRALTTLLRLGLFASPETGFGDPPVDNNYMLTDFGYDLVEASEPPDLLRKAADEKERHRVPIADSK
jgi:hypothetical protein